MGIIAYTVIASLPDDTTRDRYVSWLESGHVRDVVDAGAVSGDIVVIEDPGEPILVETRYSFASRADLDDYLRIHAPRLRAEGVTLFGPESGVVFTRTIGRVI